MGVQISSALCTVHAVTNRMPKGVSTASVNKVSAKTSSVFYKNTISGK